MAIYGAGQQGDFLQWYMEKSYEIKVDCFIDKGKAGTKLNGIDILPLDEFKKRAAVSPFFVMVSLADYPQNEITKKEIDDYLKGCKLIRYIGLENTRITWPFKGDWWNRIKENAVEFDGVCDSLADELSKVTMEEYFKIYILGQRFEGTTFLEENKYWGIDGKQNELFELKEDEVVIDVGAAWGDTIYQYIKCQLPFKKIVGVESDTYRQSILHYYINILPGKYKNKIEIIDAFFGKGKDTIDCVLSKEDVSLILMDVEGAEMDVLKTAVETIARKRPVLSICVYHRWDDLIKIPRFIKENCKDYVMILRKYPSNYMPYFDGIQQANELVLYAIPKERYLGRGRM